MGCAVRATAVPTAVRHLLFKQMVSDRVETPVLVLTVGNDGKHHARNTGCLLALVWLLIAVLGDYFFIVKAFTPVDGYYKLDVYIYYALTLVIPLFAGWRRTSHRPSNLIRMG